MGEIETFDCPNCGASVPTSGGPVSFSSSSAGTTSNATERATCPECDAELKRDNLPGASWQLALVE